MADLPERSNVFGTLSVSEPLEAVSILGCEGWSIRKCGFAEFEARDEISEFTIEAASPVLIHGPCALPEATVEKLAHAFRREGLRFSFEVYDSSGKLTRKITDDQTA
jgi:hypothetical protein